MISFIVGILLAAAFLYLALIFESTAFCLFAIAIILLLVLSGIYLYAGSRNVGVLFLMPITIAEKNKEFHAQVQVHHNKRLGYSKMIFFVEYGNTMEKKKYKTSLTAIKVPSQETTYQYALEITAPGNYEFTLKRVRIYDPFGIFYINKKIGSTTNALVLPDIREIPVSLGEHVRNFYMDSDVYDELRPGYDPAETFNVRSFQPGDKLQSVHWKLSAKMDELMVRENSLPKPCPVLLYVDYDDENTTAMLELTASLSFSLMDAGCGHFAVWTSRETGDIMRARIYDEESYYRFLTAMLQDKSTTSHEDIQERYNQKYRGETGLHQILLQKGKLYVDGSVVGDTANMELSLN